MSFEHMPGTTVVLLDGDLRSAVTAPFSKAFCLSKF